MTPMFTSPVEKTINQQLRDLEREKRALERARQALKGPAGGRKPAARRGKAGGKKETRADQAFDWIKSHPGTTAAEISEAIGVSRPHAYQLANKLVGQEVISSEGGKYQARRPVTGKAAQG